MLTDMEEKLTILLEYGSDIYQNNDSVQGALMEIFGDMLDFCTKAWHLFQHEDDRRRSSLKLFLKSLGSSFEMQFGPILRKFEKDVQIFEERAQLCDRRETKEYRSMQTQVLKYQVAQGLQTRVDIAFLAQQHMSVYKNERQFAISQARETKAIEAMLHKKEQSKQQGTSLDHFTTRNATNQSQT